MKNLFNKFIVSDHELIVNEDDVVRVLGVINSCHKRPPEMSVGNCGWSHDPKKWYIFFMTTEQKWELIRKELKVIRVFDIKDIPENSTGVVFTTD